MRCLSSSVCASFCSVSLPSYSQRTASVLAFRKPFVPPTSETPVSVRSITYLGEEHPAANKRVLTVPVAHLPLTNDKAVHKLKLLAGPRWSPSPPKDGGFRKGEAGKEGYVKIACEEFPQPNMNLKWASDTLDRLVAEANVRPSRFFFHLRVSVGERSDGRALLLSIGFVRYVCRCSSGPAAYRGESYEGG